MDGASNASSTFLPSPIDAPPSLLPNESTEALSGDTSIHSGGLGLSFGSPGSPLSKFNRNFGFPTFQDDLACKESASRDSLDCSVVDGIPSSAPVNIIPPIPSMDLHLRNLPISDGLPLEPHSVYFSAIEGDLSVFRGSDDGPEPVHETSSSLGSTSDLCIPSAEEAHHQIFWREHPSPRRSTARIEVRNDGLGQGGTGQESFTYACKSLPYNAGFRPHAFVDNREHTIHSKHHLEALAEGLHDLEEPIEDHVTGKSKRRAIFRKLVGGKGISKLMALGQLKFPKTPKRPSVDPCNPNPQSSAAFYSISNPAGRSSLTTDDPNCFPTPLPSSPPPSYPTLDKNKDRTFFEKTRSGSQSLSMFVVPKPKVEGRVVPSPKELPMCLPAGETPPSPSTSPQMHDGEIPQTDVHGRLYGPSRVASPDPSPRNPDPSIFGRKERRSWLTNVRSPKNSPLVA